MIMGCPLLLFTRFHLLASQESREEKKDRERETENWVSQEFNEELMLDDDRKRT